MFGQNVKSKKTSGQTFSKNIFPGPTLLHSCLMSNVQHRLPKEHPLQFFIGAHFRKVLKHGILEKNPRRCARHTRN